MARNFNNWLKAYMDFTADSESPSAFHFWTGVWTVGGALRRRVWLDMKKFQWTPNFYIILVGPPGVAAKSTSIGIGMRLLSKVPDIRFGPESMTWQALAGALAEAIEYGSYVDANGKQSQMAMSCLSICIQELGTFLRMEDDQLLSFLIRMWEGQMDKFLHKTKSSGDIEVENPWLNVIGATTPAWLRNNFPEYMIGGGLTSRIVFVYGDHKRQLIPYPDEVIPSAQYQKLESELIADLTQISKICGPYTLSDDARIWGRDWYARHNDPSQRPEHLSSDRYGGYVARKQTHLHKFSIILAAAKRDTRIIEREDLVEAEKIITSTEPNMIRVFESIGVVDEARHIHEIVGFVTFLKECTSDELWYRCMNVMSFKDFEQAVRAAVRGNLLEIFSKGGKPAVRLATKPQGTPP